MSPAPERRGRAAPSPPSRRSRAVEHSLEPVRQRQQPGEVPARSARPLRGPIAEHLAPTVAPSAERVPHGRRAAHAAACVATAGAAPRKQIVTPPPAPS